MNIKIMIKKLILNGVLNLRHLFYAWYGAFKYKHPSEELLVIGITGTTGKSSTVFLLRQLLEAAGHTVGSLSTIDFYIAGENKLNDQKMTMLGKMQIQKYLREMVDKKCDIAIVETTSEGRVQHRHRFINYDMMMLTNLYPEHIDSHGSFEAYKLAKLDLFKYVSKGKRKKEKGKIALVNGNSEYADEFLDFNFDKKFTFGVGNKKLYTDNVSMRADNISVKQDGLHFSIGNKKFHAPLYGEHNVSNLLAVITIAKVLSIDTAILQKCIKNIQPIPGRVEFIYETEKFGFQTIVDYAFEPKAMNALYEVVDLINPKRIIHVFGSTGGGRDKDRRFKLGEMIGSRADICIVTDEDPYDDDPMEIIDDVTGAVASQGKELDNNLFKILDRKKAIKKAIDMAKKGDMILVTGKGSEQGMCVAGGKMISWDDREIVRSSLKVKSL